MPVVAAVLPAIAAGIGASTAAFTVFGLTVLQSSILVGVASFALSTLSSFLAPSPKKPDFTSRVEKDKGITQLIRSSNEPQKIIYGERPVSGVLVFADTTGTSNQLLHLVIALAGHQVSSIGTVILNDTGIDDSDIDSSGNVTSGRFAGTLIIKKHLGYEDQEADSTLVAASSNWTVDHRLRGIAYLYLQLEFDRDVYPTGIPNVKALVKGKLFADPRDTAIVVTSSSIATQTLITTGSAHGLAIQDRVQISGHSGATPEILGEYQVISVPSSTTFTIDVNVTVAGTGGSLLKLKWSDNSILAIRDYLTSGFGLLVDPSSGISDSSFIAAANICDEEVPLPSTIDSFPFTVDFASGTFTQTVATEDLPKAVHPQDGVEFTTTGTLPGGLALSTKYYMFTTSGKKSPFTFKVASSIVNARAGVPVTLTSDGTGTHTLVRKTQLRYTTNGIITRNERPIDVINDLITPMGGALTFTQGKYTAFAGAYNGPATISLDESDLRDKMIIHPRPGKDILHNSVRGTFSDRDNEFLPTDFPPIVNAVFVANDKGEKIFKDVDLPFITDTWRAQRLAKLINIRDREGLTVDFPAKLTALQLSVMEVIKVSITHLGWADKEFEILGWKISKEGGIDLSLKETAAVIYSFDADTDQTVATLAPNTNLSGAFDPAPPPTNLLLVRQVIEGPVGSAVRIQLSWTPPEDHRVTEVGSFEIQFKKSADPNYEPSFFVDGRETLTFVAPVVDGTFYDVRIRSVSYPGATRSSWAEVLVFPVGNILTSEDWGLTSGTPTTSEDWGLISAIEDTNDDWGLVS